LPGLQAERLRLSLADRLPAGGFAGLLRSLLQAGDIAQGGPWLRLPAHQIALSAQDQLVWQGARPLLEAERFRPPRTRDVAAVLRMPEAAVRTTLKRLQRMGELVEVAPDHFFPRETVAEMAVIAADVAAAEGTVTAAAFRDRLDNGRKVAIQILEFFDRTGVTERAGDTRRVRPERVGLFGPPPA
jgi:selenocysteine-specific elongation factor